MCGQNCQHSMQSRTVVAQFVSCSFQDHKISGPKWALVCCQIVRFKRMKRTLFQALRKQTAKIFGYAKIVVSAIFFLWKRGRKSKRNQQEVVVQNLLFSEVTCWFSFQNRGTIRKHADCRLICCFFVKYPSWSFSQNVQMLAHNKGRTCGIVPISIFQCSAQMRPRTALQSILQWVPCPGSW